MQFINQENESYKFKRYSEYESMSPSRRESYLEKDKDLPLDDIHHREQKSTITIFGMNEALERKNKIGLKNNHSRENLQMINKKMKLIKDSLFAASVNRTPEKKEMASQMKLTGFSKSLAHISKTKSIECHQKLRSSYNPEEKYGETIKVRKNFSDNTMEGKSTLEPRGFRTTLKKKYIDDNPKVLANIIKKKVEILKGDQIQVFIENLMKRNRS